MDIEKVRLDIINIKNPLVFIFKLSTNNINDSELNIILRLFLKYHSETALSFNLKELFNNKIIDDFYELIHKKVSLLMILKRWYDIYKNNDFWECDDKVKFLLETKEYFLGIFDCSHGGTPFHIKLIDLFNCNNYDKYEVLYNIKDRLELILKIFGPGVFECIGIPLIKVSDFLNFSHHGIITYLTAIFNDMSELLNQTIILFTNYNNIIEDLENLLNPVILTIESSEINSDIDVDDFN
jgi:hypothetical protein